MGDFWKSTEPFRRVLQSSFIFFQTKIVYSYVNNQVLYDQVSRPTKFTKEQENYMEQAALALQVENLFYLKFSKKKFLSKELRFTIIS